MCLVVKDELSIQWRCWFQSAIHFRGNVPKGKRVTAIVLVLTVPVNASKDRITLTAFPRCAAANSLSGFKRRHFADELLFNSTLEI